MHQPKYTTQRQPVQDEIIWDCPSCDSDEAQFHRTGKLAGTAICKVCSHKWNWRRKSAPQSQDFDTENASTRFQQKKGLSTERSTQDQAALKDVGRVNSWLNETRPPIPTLAATSNFRTADDGSFARARQKVQELRERVAAKDSVGSSSKARPESIADEMLDAWPKRELKKTLANNPLLKIPSYALADSASSESEFEFSASEDDFEEEPATQKRKRAKGKQLAVPKQPSRNKSNRTAARSSHTVAQNDDDDSNNYNNDDDDNDSIFSDTGNDVYMSGEELDEEEEKMVGLKDFSAKDLAKSSKDSWNRSKPNAKNKYSMWIMYNKANRQRIASEHPEASTGTLSKLVSEAYRKMPMDEREELRKISLEYKKEVAKLQAPRTSAPRNGYILFNMEISGQVLKENPEFRMRDRNAVTSRRWKALSDEERKEYSARAKQMREDFQKRFPEKYQSLKEKRGAKVAESLLKHYAEKKRKLNWQLGLDEEL